MATKKKKFYGDITVPGFAKFAPSMPEVIPQNNLSSSMAGTTITLPKLSASQPSMADFRQLDQASTKLPLPEYTPKEMDFETFVNQGNPEFVQNNPFLSKVLAMPGYAQQKVADLFPQGVQNWANRIGETGAETATMNQMPNKSTTGNTTGDVTADLLGFLVGIGANPGGVTSIGGAALKGGDIAFNGAKISLPKLAGLEESLAGRTAMRGMKGATAGSAYGAAEGLSQGEDAKGIGKDILANAAMFAGADMGLGALGEGLGKAVSRTKSRKVEAIKEEPDDFVFDLGEPQGVDFTADQFGNVRRGEALPELPAGKQPLVLPAGNVPKALTGQQPLMLPAGKVPNWEYGTGYPKEGVWFADQYGNLRNTPDVPKMLPEGKGNTFAKNVSGDETFIPRSDIGDPQYLASLEQRYNQMVADEVANLKQGMGNKPTQGGLGFDGEGNVVSRFGRVSNNNPWYSEFYAKNGRPPREGEIRDIAIENLINGNRITGEPANDEFHSLLSELARGQKLPEEWHGLQKSIRDLENVQKTDIAMTDAEGITPLLSDMKTAQKQSEPFGLNKNLDRLTEIENQVRQRMKDRADFRKQYPDAIGIVARNPLDDLKDLTIIGAAKIAKGTIEFAQWSKEMIDEFGQIIEKQLPGIWKHANILAKDGQTTLKIKNHDDVVVKFELPQGAQTSVKASGNTINPAEVKNSSTGAGEANTVKQSQIPDKTWNHVTSKTKKPDKTVKNVIDKAYETTVDDLHILSQVDREAYMQALNSRESGGVALNIVKRGLADARGNTIGESLKDITKQIPKGAETDFENYLIYRHAPAWLEQGKNVFPVEEGITPEIARQRAMAYQQARPEFKQLGDRLIKWQNDLGQAWLVDTGIISQKSWDAMRELYPDYIPFQRLMNEMEVSGSGVKKGFANQGSPIKKAEGSQREIISPIESIIEHVDKYVKTAKRNEVMQTLYGKIKESPDDFKDFIEIMPEKGETFESVFQRDGLDGFIKWLEEPFEAVKAKKDVSYDKPNIVRGIINGETVHFQVKDPALLNALATLSPQGQNVIIESIRQVTRTMKVLTTGANLIFSTRNAARDLPMAYISSDTLVKTPVQREIQFAWGILDSLARIVTSGLPDREIEVMGKKIKLQYDPGSYYKSFRAMGGGTHSSSMAADRNLLAESKASVMPGYYSVDKPLTSAWRGAKAGGRGIEKITNAVETLPRLPEYIRTVKQGGDSYASRQQGLYNAQDVTVNFSKHGSVAKDADAFIPYLNAALQGIDKVARIYAKDPAGAVYRSLVAATVPTIGLWLINRNDPQYRKLSGWVKDNYYCVPLPNGKFLKVAKPREVGVVFSSTIERALNTWANDDPQGFKGFSEAWVRNFMPPIRTIAAPITDVASNKNYAGLPIVPGYMEKLEPQYQYDETTSQPAKALGGLLNYSPKKIDYLIRGYTGVIGELGIPATAQGRGENGLQRVGNTLSKTFTADPLYSNDVMNDFYTLKDKYDKANSTFKATGNRGEYFNPDKVSYMNRASDAISEINKEIRRINADQSIPYEQKDMRVRELKQKALDIAGIVTQKMENSK